ncbi:MAG: type II secretion system protein GspG, partial [Verrucomicrobiae bacterium]|nr:type II secretion system protein GspG [Verrucomicrobiae bacterium]
GYYPRTLEDLETPPSGNSQDWRGPYLKKGIPLDPWGNGYLYEYPGRRNPAGYDLASNGPDGRSGNEDDIGNWLEDARQRR